MKKFLAKFLVLAFCVSILASCGGQPEAKKEEKPAQESKAKEEVKEETKKEEEQAGEVIINYPTFQIGANTAAPVTEELVNGFNEMYKGQYKIVVEDVPGDQNYADKIKVQMSSGKLPPVVYGGGKTLLDLALQSDMVLSINDAVEADADWKAMYDDQWMAKNARDGVIYASSQEAGKIGYFYNKELFEQAGIEPAKTWDEFFENCEKLKAAGITPISMDTADGAWCAQLMMGAMIATASDEGLELMQTVYPENYSIDPVVKAIEKMQYMYQNYTTEDANGGAYENAANNFLSGNTAMIANGPWMIGDFYDTSKAPEGFYEKVGVAIYPGGFYYNDPLEGMFVTKQDDPKLEEASIAMVKYFTSAEAQTKALEIQGMVPASSTVEITDVAKEKFPLLADFLDQAEGAKLQSGVFVDSMVPGLADIFSQELPNLAAGDMTAEELCQILTEFAQENSVK